MPDQLVLAVATALAAKGAEVLFSGGRDAVGALYRMVRSRFGEGTEESAALEAAVVDPDDYDRQAVLADALARTMAVDPAFDAAVRAEWRSVQARLSVAPGDVTNEFSGTAGKVVQARDISGDILF